MMEIKKGYKQSDLYKLCLKFFSLEKLNSLENSILVFVSTLSVREYLVNRLKEEQKAVYTKIESGNYIILDAEDLKNTNLKVLIFEELSDIVKIEDNFEAIRIPVVLQ
jgi:hypothetical protein